VIRLITSLLVFVATYSTVYPQWVQTNGLDSMFVTALVVSDTNLFAGINVEGVFRSTDSGASWTEVNSGLTNTNVVGLFVSGTSLFARTFIGGVCRTTDSGTSWTLVNSLPANTSVTCFAATDRNLFVGTEGVFAGCEGGIFRSTDNGASWTPVNSGLLPNTDVGALAVSPNGRGGTNVVAGATIREGTYHGCIYLSTNLGTQWAEVSSGFTGTSISYFGVGCFGVSGTNIFASLGSGVLRSTDGGTSWTRLNSWRTDQQIMSFAVSGINIFAATLDSYGTLGGVVLSTDNGTSWTHVDSGLPTDKWVSSSAVVGTNLFSGTSGAGVWNRPLSEMITSAGPVTIGLAGNFVLSQNYPNPFNPVTQIGYTIAGSKEYGVGSREVKLIVYDLLGREVAVLVNERKSPGNHEVQFNASGLASGVYFYRLTTGTFVETKKLLLLR
jgi:photosystem II stability/assembly factor-like uncharacterized protein